MQRLYPSHADPALQDFALAAVLGEGAEALVIAARDRRDGRQVALKVLDEDPDPAAAASLELLRGLRHPGIVTLLETRRLEDGRPLLVLEFLEGTAWLEAWAKAPDSAHREEFLLRLLEALAFLHSRGLVHGDLKPDNLLVVADGEGMRPVLVDFGMALRRSRGGFAGGTPEYFAPEVAAGGDLGPRSDLYALGLCVLQAISGADRPRRSLPRPWNESEGLRRVVRRLVARRPEERPADAEAALAAARLQMPGARATPRLPEHLPFVGREAQMAEAHAFLAEVVDTRRGVRLCLAGEEGVGRRRFVGEFLREAGGRGWWTAAWSAGDDLARFLGRLLAPLGAAGKLPLILDPTATRGPGGVAEERMPQRIARACVAALGDRRVLLGGPEPGILDRELREFLNALAELEVRRRKAGARGLLVLVHPGDPADLRPDNDRLLPLPPLSPAAIRTLLVELFGGTTRGLAEFARALHEHAGGWPGVVQLLLGALLREAALRFDGTTLRWDDSALLRSADEIVTRGLARTRWDALPEASRRLVTFLALAESPLEASALAKLAAPLGIPDLHDALRELADQGFVNHLSVHGRTSFALGLRAAASFASEELDEEARSSLHRRLAEVTDGGRAAFHHHFGGTPLDRDALRLAVESLLGEGEARLGLRLADDAGSEHPALQLRRARALEKLGRLEEASDALLRLASAEKGADSARAAALFARIAMREDRLEQARDSAARAVNSAALPAEEQARVRSFLAFLHLKLGDLEAAAEAAAEARTSAEDFPVARAIAEHVAGLVATRQGCWDKAASSLGRALRLLETEGERHAAAVARMNAALVRLRRGDHEGAVAGLRPLAAAFAGLGDPDLEAQCTLNLGVAWSRAGKPRRAIEAFGDAAELLRTTGRGELAATVEANEGIARGLVGTPARAAPLLRHALGKLGDARAQLIATLHLARVRRDQGRCRSARRMTAGALLDARRHALRPEFVEACALAASLARDPASAARWIERVERAEPGPELRDALAAARIEGMRRRDGDEAARAELKRAPEAGRELSVLAARLGALDRAGIAQGLRRARTDGRLGDLEALTRAAATASVAAGRARQARRFLLRSFGIREEREDGMSTRARQLFRISSEARDLEELRRRCESALALLSRSGDHSAARELVEVSELLRGLNEEGSRQRILERIAASASKLFGADQVHIALVDRSGELAILVARSAEGKRVPAEREHISRSILHDVVALRRSLVIADALEDTRYQQLHSVAGRRIRSAACVPLRDGETCAGALYLDGGDRVSAFGEEDLALLEAFGDLAAVAIRAWSRHREMEREHGSLRAQLRTQRSLAAARERELRSLRVSQGGARIVGGSESMERARRDLERAAASGLNVVVRGESGVGKELFARGLHDRSARAGRPFVAVNCAAVTSTLFEAEFFGHERGAFTNADASRPGLFAMADGGTLFLDEIGELPLELQPKLLRPLQEGRVRPIGGEEFEVDVRVVCATSRPLAAEVEAGRFREDLYYRLRGVEIVVPPLRDRVEDIPELAAHFLADAGLTKRLDAEARRRLEAAPWPGNVRQLRNEILRAAQLGEGELIGGAELSLEIQGFARSGERAFSDPSGEPLPLREIERRAIEFALEHSGGDRKAAARQLGISRSALYEKLKRYREEETPKPPPRA